MVIIFVVSRVGGSGGNVFNVVDFYVGVGKGMESGLGIGVGSFGIVIYLN